MVLVASQSKLVCAAQRFPSAKTSDNEILGLLCTVYIPCKPSFGTTLRRLTCFVRGSDALHMLVTTSPLVPGAVQAKNARNNRPGRIPGEPPVGEEEKTGHPQRERPRGDRHTQQLDSTRPCCTQPYAAQPSCTAPDYDASTAVPDVQYTAELLQRGPTTKSHPGQKHIRNERTGENGLRQPQRPLHATTPYPARDAHQTH